MATQEPFMKMPSRDEMRAEFHRLTAELAAAQAKLKPKQDAYEKKHAELSERERKELKPLADDLKATRDGLDIHGIQQQLATVSRALGGETGAPPSAAADQA
jgi:Skp family chaperone for outer membrane proteins